MRKRKTSYLNSQYNNSHKKRKKIFIVIGILLFLILARIIITITSKNKKAEIKLPDIPVEASIAKVDLIRDVIYLTERLQPASEVQVFAPVTGWLDHLYVEIGSRVYKRQIIATIDRNIVGTEYTKAIVKAPISGEVGRIFLDIGATVAPNIPIMSIVNYDTLKIYANIPEKYVYRVKQGDVVLINVESLPNEEFIGKIKKISSSIDPMTGTFQARIDIPNRKHRLKPGSFANIKIIVDMKKTVIIPRDAIVNFESKNPYVFKITNNISRKVHITKGIIEEDKVEIIKGVKAGDIVIVTGTEIVKDGSKVKIVNAKEIGLTNKTKLKEEK